MAKFTATSVVLALLFLLGVAQAFRTMITTTIEEDTNQGGGSSQRCQQQIQRQQQQLQGCQRFLQQSGGRGSLFMVTAEDDMDMSMNPQEQQEQQLRQCCSGLQNIRDTQCRCEAVRQAVQQGQQQGGRGQQERQQAQEMLERARNLPSMCNLEPQQCQISSLLF